MNILTRQMQGIVGIRPLVHAVHTALLHGYSYIPKWRKKKSIQAKRRLNVQWPPSSWPGPLS